PLYAERPAARRRGASPRRRRRRVRRILRRRHAHVADRAPLRRRPARALRRGARGTDGRPRRRPPRRDAGGAAPRGAARAGGGAARRRLRLRERMAGPMDGVRVVELAFWVAGPSAAAILADWGAEVVKIEPPDGDPFRGLFLSAAGLEVPANPPFELDNRGKRSIALDFTKETGREIALRLIDRADVFVTNLRP